MWEGKHGGEDKRARRRRWLTRGARAARGVWQRVFQALSADADNEYAMIDATVDALGNPTGFTLTPGQASDLVGADALLPAIAAATVIADKGYDAEERVLAPLREAGTVAVIPTKRNRADQRDYDRHLYRAASDREFLLPAQALSGHRHPLRQDPAQLPGGDLLRGGVDLAQLPTCPGTLTTS